MFKRFLILILCITLCVSSANVACASPIDELDFTDISIETEDNITRDMSLITHYQGTECFRWSSNKADVISESGVVSRPLPGEDPISVKLSAEEISTGSTKNFFVTVKPFENDEEVMQKIKLWLEFSLLSTEELSSVKSDFSLLTTGLYDSLIYWESSDESIVAINGADAIVSRPPVGEGNANVILTANIVFGESFAKEYFLLQVPSHDYTFVGNKNLKEACDEFEKTFLNVQNITDIREDLIIPKSNNKNIVITLSSDEKSYLSDEGEITRSITEDVIANLVVTFRLGYETTRRSYPIVIKAIEESTLIQNIENDLQWLREQLAKNHKLDRLTENLNKIETGPYGTKFSYSSSNESVVSNNGIVSRQETNYDVILTVYGYAHGETLNISIPISVLAKTVGGSTSVQGGGTTISGGGGSDSPYIQIEDAYLITMDFDDLPSTHWAYDAVHYLYKSEIINGVSENMFSPNSPVTREQFVKMLINSPLGFTIDNYDTPFEDTNKNSWYYPFVSTAYYYGAVKGISKELFGVGQFISRQDLAVIIYNVLGRLDKQLAIADHVAFNDIDEVSDYAKDAVSILKKHKLISGKGNNEYCPKDTLTRAEAATIIYRLITLK